MEKLDSKKLTTAITYLERISNGRNPVNNKLAEDDAVINDPNVVRCMFFVKEVLEEIKKNDGYIGRKPRKNRDNTKADYPLDVLRDFCYTEDKPISKLVEQLNGLADMTKYKRLNYDDIRKWLISRGLLETKGIEGMSKKVVMPTTAGVEMGIRFEMRQGKDGKEYAYVYYDRKAQEFIVANLREIVASD